jgi:hypothetical protein
MKYVVEFEMGSDRGDSVSEVVYAALVSAFGKIDKLRIAPVKTYIGYIQENQAILWSEFHPYQSSDQ